MATFGVIDNNKIINLIIADDLETAELVSKKPCIESINGSIGRDYILIQETGEWVHPASLQEQIEEL